MPGINAAGVPYPLDTDPIADWPAILTEMVAALRAMARGTITLSDGGAAPAARVVTFPAGMFSSPPGVFLSHGTADSGTPNVSNLWVGGITADQCTITLNRETTTTITVHWLAIG